MFRSPSLYRSTKSREELIRRTKNFSALSRNVCDAAIVTTSYAYESVSLDAVKQWFSDIQKEVHVLEPLLPPGYGTKTQNSEEGIRVVQLLQRR